MSSTRLPADRLLDAINSGRYPFWFPNGARGLALDYFAYGTDFVPLAASATTTNPIAINSDSAFFILAATGIETATDNTTFLTQHPLMVQLAEGGSSRNFFNTALHFDEVFGSAEFPMVWPLPKLLLPNSTLNVTLQNLEATARNVRIALHGFKVFNFAK